MAKGGDGKLKKITFGGPGWRAGPGKFSNNYGVAVSADNEIFVTDFYNRRVQVFSINGAYLRLFPTIVSAECKKMGGCKTVYMHPSGVAFDVDPGYMWVVGQSKRHLNCKLYDVVVRYSTNGQLINKFDVGSTSFYPAIAMDMRNNKIIVGEKDRIMMFHPNGTLYWSSKLPGSFVEGVTSDREGNILLTDGKQSVKVYNPSGVQSWEFGKINGPGKGQLRFPKGICLDFSGRIIVANTNNRVDMFTSRGEFIRTIAIMEEPWGIATGPDGELVVTSPRTQTVTVFPRQMVRL
ncbi:hypothetical protein Bbelb_275860 [Branchiostoma belcheri]|nr:hypothetical protein Bbelb_275860 [Branchiostoma belcheri]